MRMTPIQVIERKPITSTLTLLGQGKQVIGSVAAEALDTIPADAGGVFITVETMPIRYWISGADPDATTGHQVAVAGNIYFSHRRALDNLMMIGVGGDATIQVTYYI